MRRFSKRSPKMSTKHCFLRSSTRQRYGWIQDGAGHGLELEWHTIVRYASNNSGSTTHTHTHSSLTRMQCAKGTEGEEDRIGNSM